jgi:hypothetical protein
MVKVSPDSNYVSAQFCIDNLFKDVVILDEGAEVESEFQGKKSIKLQVKVQCTDKAKSLKTWSINQTSKRTLIKIFGDETKLWVGRKVRLQFVDSQGKPTIYVDELETRQLNATVQQTVG